MLPVRLGLQRFFARDRRLYDRHGTRGGKPMEAVDKVGPVVIAWVFLLTSVIGALLGLAWPLKRKGVPAQPPVPSSGGSERPAPRAVLIPPAPAPVIVVQRPPLCVEVVEAPTPTPPRERKPGDDLGKALGGLLMLGLLAALFGGGSNRKQ
jgi:hypothetical protein